MTERAGSAPEETQLVDRHAEARARERLVAEAADRAFALMRDRGALRELVARHAPEGVDEIALALDDKERPAHLVVSRTGRAVTCLAAGMSPMGAVVPFAVVDDELARRARALDVRVAAHVHAGRDEGHRPLEQLARAPELLVRDDLALIERLSPLVVDDLARAVEQTVARLGMAARDRHLRLDDDAARALFRMVLFSAHALVVGRRASEMLPHALSALVLDDAILAPRALWTLANQPEATLSALEQDARFQGALPAPIARLLVVIAARHATHAARARAVLAQAGLSGAPLDARDGRTALVFWLHAPLLLGRYCPSTVRDMPVDARRALIEAAERDVRGATLPWRAVAARLGPWFVRIADLLDVERWIAHPAADVHTTPAHHQGERVRIILWRAMFTRALVPLAMLPVEVELALSAAPFAALLPRERPDPLVRSARAPQLARALVKELAERHKRESVPAVAEPRPARNASCPCGSGKKYKNCHGKA